MVNMSLVQAIDQAVAYVHAHPDQMTRAELEEFSRLAESVYFGAIQADLIQALPQVPELRPQLESADPPLPPVQFETKLNLPGDWDYATVENDEPLPLPRDDDEGDTQARERVFLVAAPPRWLHDMGVLSKLALEHESKSNGPIETDQAWPNQTEVAKGLGTNKTQIGRLIDSGELKTNEKPGRACRVDPASILDYCKSRGVAWNDKA
jgi:hypothetical protein